MWSIITECLLLGMLVCISANNINRQAHSNLTVADFGSEELESLLEEEGVRVRDLVWEGMVKTAWLDYITRINKDKELYGLKIEPLRLSHVMEDELYISQTMLGYQVELWMWNLTLHGLSGLTLEKLSLERSPGLTDVFTYALLSTPQLALTGMYRMQGTTQGTGALAWVLQDISSEVRYTIHCTSTQ